MSDTAVSINEYLRQLHKNKRNRNRFATFLMMLSLVVSIGVVWELRGIGISMTNETDCGIEEHIHSPACYETLLLCGLEEGEPESDDAEAVLHIHAEECFEKRLVCTETEHAHTVECLKTEETFPDEAAASDDTAEDSTEETELEETFSEEPDAVLLEALRAYYPDGIEEEELITVYWELLAEYPDCSTEDILALLQEPVEEEMQVMALSQTAIDEAIRTAQENIPENVQENRVYVVTANGVRDKDMVHEYLAEGLSWINAAHDEYYVYNSSQIMGRYTMLPGDTVVVVGYSTSENRRIYLDAAGWPEDVVEFRNQEPVYKNGYYVSTAYLTVKSRVSTEMKLALKHHVDSFYIEIEKSLENDGKPSHYDHADIEITDGGYFETKTIVKYPNSEQIYQTVTTRYESWVSSVHHCFIYDSDNREIGHFVTEDYVQRKELGSTQFELTSQEKCNGNPAKWYDRERADHAKFDIDMRLSPKSMTVVTYDINGVQQGEPEVFDNLQTGEDYDILVEHAIFDLDRQSVLDAKNKCPNHSGLDFNVVSMEKTVDIVPPAQAQFTANKSFLGGNLQDKQFGFHLVRVDENGLSNVDETNKSTVTKPDGSIDFDTVYFYAPGTYHYKIAETIPAGATKYSDTQYSFNEVLYDAREIDVYVDVVIKEDLKALLFSQGNNSNATLERTVRYELNGQTISPPFQFQNESVKEKKLTVNKVWDDGAAAHTTDSVKFRINCRYGSGAPFAVVRDGNTIFQLDATNGWSRTFENLPFEIGGQECTYEVEELAVAGYSAEYSMDESDNHVVVTISNRKKEDVQIHVEKKWFATETLEMTDEEIPVDSISVTLTRKYRKIPIPVTINVQRAGAGEGEYAYSYVENAYEGAGLKFRVKDGNTAVQDAELVSAINCQCSKRADGSMVITDLQPNAEVTVQLDKEVWHRTSGGGNLAQGDGFYKWSMAGGSTSLFNYCYSTAHTIDGDGAESLQVYNRTAEWHAGLLKLNPEQFHPGSAYSFSAYMMSRNYFDSNGKPNEGAAPDTNGITFVMDIRYTYSDNGEIKNGWKNIGTYQYQPSEYFNWVQVSNVDCTIPENAIDVYLSFSTREGHDSSLNSYKCASIYIDDVMIGPAGRELAIDENANYYFFSADTVEKEVPTDAMNWTPDTSWDEVLVLNAGNDWKQRLLAADLSESVSREYQYYAAEDTVPELFKVSYSGNGVSSNTENTPIGIRNTQAEYILPSTGGAGAHTVQLLGLITLLCTGIAGVYIKKRKRRSSA